MIGLILVAFAYGTKIILSAAINTKKFSLGYSLLINLGPVGEWGRLPTCHSGLGIPTTVRYQQPSLLTFEKSILSYHYFTEKKTLLKLQFHPSLQTNLPTVNTGE